MLTCIGGQACSADLDRLTLGELDEVHFEARLDLAGTWKEHFARRVEPLLEADRPDDRQRRFAADRVMGVDLPPDQAGKVVAVKMRDEDRLDRARIEALTVHSDQCAGAAINKKLRAVVVDVETRLQTPTRAERVAAADHRQLHVIIFLRSAVFVAPGHIAMVAPPGARWAVAFVKQSRPSHSAGLRRQRTTASDCQDFQAPRCGPPW